MTKLEPEVRSISLDRKVIQLHKLAKSPKLDTLLKLDKYHQ